MTLRRSPHHSHWIGIVQVQISVTYYYYCIIRYEYNDVLREEMWEVLAAEGQTFRRNFGGKGGLRNPSRN